MADISPSSLPDFKTLFLGEVYTVDYLATEHLDLSNPDLNALRRGFLVLGRYRKPDKSEVSVYLQQTIQQHLSSKTQLDPQMSPLIAALPDQELISLLKGDQQRIVSSLVAQEQKGNHYADAHYFTLPAPLYVNQGKKIKDPGWYHDAFTDQNLREQGLYPWFLIHLQYHHLFEPQKIAEQIQQSSLQEKEGTIYAMNNICKAFSSPEHFAQMKDITSRKIKEAAVETLLSLQKENSSHFSKPKADIILN